MKYKDFEKLLKSYERMAQKNIRDGKPEYAEMCYMIMEDLRHLFKLGYSNSPTTAKKKKKTK